MSEPAHSNSLPPEIMKQVLEFQKNEITEFAIYSRLADLNPGGNGDILRSIAQDKQRHYDFWRKHTDQDAAPDKMMVFM